MSHAIIRAGGKQFLVKEGQTIRVPTLEAETGSSIELETLLTSGDNAAKATVVSHGPEDRRLQEEATQTVQTDARTSAGLHGTED